jgi:hypothetical protein
MLATLNVFEVARNVMYGLCIWQIYKTTQIRSYSLKAVCHVLYILCIIVLNVNKYNVSVSFYGLVTKQANGYLAFMVQLCDLVYTVL